MNTKTPLRVVCLLAAMLVATFNTPAAGPPNVPPCQEHPNAPAPYGAIPTVHQVNWQRLEFYAFVCFGLNTFTGQEWGYGNIDPKIFNPTDFNADAIVTTLKAGGMRGMIYTAKHHDGWCGWPTKSTEYNITKSPFQGGKGDIVRDFSQACKKHDFHFGAYVSPWDRNHAEYGREGYITSYYMQIEELLTHYGPLFEIWFDGANGGDGYYGGARGKRNIGDAGKYYNFEQIVKTVHAIQPQCIVWGAGHFGDARWGGSEKGYVNYPCWNTVNSQGKWIGGGTGVRDGDRWVPAEADTPINHAGWFWHKGQAKKVKSPEQLLDIWFESVGRGANLILNLAPDQTGQLDPADVKALMGFKALRDRLYATDFARDANGKAGNVRAQDPAFGPQNLFDDNPDTYWASDDDVKTPTVEIKLPDKATFDVVRVREQIRLGQRVEGWAVDAWLNGQWQEVLVGSAIGNQAMLKLKAAVTTDRVRLRITKSSACPTLSEFSLLLQPGTVSAPQIVRDNAGSIMIRGGQGGEIRFTIDGSEPNRLSAQFTKPFPLARGGVVKAVVIGQGTLSSVVTEEFGVANAKFEAVGDANGALAVDQIDDTLWEGSGPLVINLNDKIPIKAFTYLPRQDGVLTNMTDKYRFEVSMDGENWTIAAEGEFGNIKANPIQQKVEFESPHEARFIRFTSVGAIEGDAGSVAELGIIL